MVNITGIVKNLHIESSKVSITSKSKTEGYECGVTLAKFADVKEGDVYEAFKMEEYRD